MADSRVARVTRVASRRECQFKVSLRVSTSCERKRVLERARYSRMRGTLLAVGTVWVCCTKGVKSLIISKSELTLLDL